MFSPKADPTKLSFSCKSVWKFILQIKEFDMQLIVGWLVGFTAYQPLLGHLMPN